MAERRDALGELIPINTGSDHEDRKGTDEWPSAFFSDALGCWIDYEYYAFVELR